MSIKPYNIYKQSLVNDHESLKEFENLIYLNDDIRPTWQGGGNAVTDDVDNYYYVANWANQHWGLYRGFLFNENIDYNYPYVILDIGCGSGYCTRNLVEIFPNAKILAIDIDADCLSFCEKYNSHENITYIQQDLTLIQSINKAFDFIFFIETLEHIKHKHHVEVIHNLIKSLKDEKSKLFISTPKSTTYDHGKDRGHVGILNDEFFNVFEYNFRRYINYIRFYDQSKLTDEDPVQYTTFNSNNGLYQICLSNYYVNL